MASQTQTKEVRDEIVDILNELRGLGLITATGGNISARLAERPDELWITPSALHKGSLSPDMLTRVNLLGDPLDPDSLPPSSEKFVHTEILRRRADLTAVVHTHAPWATLLALTETPFLPISTEAAYVGDIPRVPFILPGTQELGAAVADALGDKGIAALMQNHGLVVAGSTLRRAANVTAVIERYSELILRCLALGKQPPVIPDEIAAMLRAKGEMMA